MTSVSSKRERETLKQIQEAILADELENTATGSLDLLIDGEHCAWGLCRQLTLLPTACQHCKKKFCKHHYQAEAHECTEVKSQGRKVPCCPKCNKALRKPKDM